MKKLVIMSMLAAVASGTAFGGSTNDRLPVDVQLVGDDGLSLKLAESLQKALRNHSLFRLASSNEKGVLTIRSKRNVSWDRLGGQTVVIYTVFVGRPDTEEQPLTGICYERAMSKCVTDILRVASLGAA